MFNNIFRKSLFAVIVVVIIGLALFLGNHNTEKVKIGFIGPLTGEYAGYGVPMKNAAELALDKIDPDHEKFEVIYEDDQVNSALAVSAVNKLINIDKVDYIISAQGSGQTQSVIPIAEENKKALVITLASAPGLVDGKKTTVRFIASDISQASVMSKYMLEKLNSQKVAGLYINDPYGLGIKSIIEKSLGNKIVDSELFNLGSKDFKTELLKIKNSGADTIVLVAREKEYPIILKQISNLGVKAVIVASETFKDENILSTSGASAEGVYTFMAEPQDHIGFGDEYKKLYGVAPSAYSMYAYDGTKALFEAISKKGDNVEKVIEYLRSYKTEGASGVVNLGIDGDRVADDSLIYKVINGKFVKQ